MAYSLSPNASERLRAVHAALAGRLDVIGGRALAGAVDAVHGAHGAHGVHDVHGGAAAPSIASHVPTGWPAVDAVLGGGLARRGLHEWWGALPDARAVLVQLAWDALLHDERHRPGAHRRVVWVGRDAWPAPGELVRGLRAGIAGMFGAHVPRRWPDARLHDRALLVDVPPHDAGARLWAIEQAVRCPGVCAVFADGRGLDLAATRRLQLAAQDVLLCTVRGAEARPGARRSTLSACSTRWMVERARTDDPAPAARIPWLRAMDPGRFGADPALHAFAARVPSEPAWQVTLERAKGVAVQLQVECGARAFRRFEWEGVDAAPAPEAAAARRRAERAARLGAERIARRAARLRDHADDGTTSGTSVPSHPHVPAPARARTHDRCASRGERWARRLG
jgi:hypothetical protein